MEKIFMQCNVILSESEMNEWVIQLSRLIPTNTVIFLQGELGAGKTTFVRGYLRGLGYQGIVKSPTYTLVEEYEMHGVMIYHFDLYRIADPSELTFIGIEEYFHNTSICFVEWSEKGVGYLVQPDMIISFNAIEASRKLTLQSMTDIGHQILKQLDSSHI